MTGGGFWDGTVTTATVGETIQINISDPSKANQTVTVNIQRSDNQTDVVDVQLDGNGEGSVDYLVPDVLSVELQSPGQSGHAIIVSQPSP